MKMIDLAILAIALCSCNEFSFGLMGDSPSRPKPSYKATPVSCTSHSQCGSGMHCEPTIDMRDPESKTNVNICVAD